MFSVCSSCCCTSSYVVVVAIVVVAVVVVVVGVAPLIGVHNTLYQLMIKYCSVFQTLRLLTTIYSTCALIDHYLHAISGVGKIPHRKVANTSVQHLILMC